MTTKKLTKEELRNPDFFLTHGHHFTEFILKHQAVIVAAISAAFLAGVIWLGVTKWQAHKEEVASTAFYPVEKRLLDEADKNKSVSDAAVTDYERVIKEESSTRTAVVSLISVTPNLLRVGKAATLSAWYKDLTIALKGDDFAFGLLKMTQALVELENHQPDAALALYQEVLTTPAQSSFHPEATLKMGVAFEMKNDLAKAREMFEKVHREHPTTRAGELAFQYLLYLDQKKGA